MQAESLKGANSPGVCHQKRKRGFPDAAKNEKKDQNQSSEKFLSARKKVKHSGMWRNKRRGFSMFCGRHSNVLEASIY